MKVIGISESLALTLIVKIAFNERAHKTDSAHFLGAAASGLPESRHGSRAAASQYLGQVRADQVAAPMHCMRVTIRTIIIELLSESSHLV
jgi:hypothetical protein